MDTAAGESKKPAQPSNSFGVGMEVELRFMRQFSVKSKAGLSAEKCLTALVGETRNLRLRRACKEMRAQVTRGISLSLAMRHQAIFDPAVIHIVEAGEQAGNLKSALANAADYLSRVGRLRRAMHDAVVKPLNVLALVLLAIFIAAVALSFLVREVVPEASAGPRVVLTFADRLAAKVAEVVRAAWPYVGVLGFLGFLSLHLLPRHPRARAGIERVALRLPLVGAAMRATARADVFRTVGILMRTGAVLGEAMEMAALTAPSLFMRNAIRLTIGRIEGGKSYIEAMVEDGLLRRRDINAVEGAERRGELGLLMLTLADDREREASDRVGTLKTVAHTTVIMLLGVVIAAVVLSLYVPVFVSR